MFSIQGLIVLVVVVWYSLIILKSTNSYYKEAYKKHLEDESRPYEPGKLAKEIEVRKVDQSENKMIHQENKAELIGEEYCQEDEEMDVCFLNSEESLVLEKMYKSYPWTKMNMLNPKLVKYGTNHGEFMRTVDKLKNPAKHHEKKKMSRGKKSGCKII